MDIRYNDDHQTELRKGRQQRGVWVCATSVSFLFFGADSQWKFQKINSRSTVLIHKKVQYKNTNKIWSEAIQKVYSLTVLPSSSDWIGSECTCWVHPHKPTNSTHSRYIPKIYPPKRDKKLVKNRCGDKSDYTVPNFSTFSEISTFREFRAF